MTLFAEFIDGAAGKILITAHEPQSPASHAVIVLPAFGEEMNKSRRLVRDTADRLARKGYLVAIPDLFGCGDSEGRMEDARLDTWNGDLCAVIEWAADRYVSRFSALSVRAGAMFLNAVLKHVNVEQVVAWQPVSGTDALHDLLRIRSLSQRMNGQQSEKPSETIRRLVAECCPIDLSGYTISSGLVADLLGADPEFGRDSWPKASAIIRFDHQQADAGTITVGGERFWRALEPGSNEELVRSTTELFPRL